MKVNIVGGSYQMDALSFGLQRSINLFPIASEVPNTKEPSAIRSTAGLNVFANAGNGGARGAITIPDVNRAFVVIANELYEVFTDGTTTLRGSLLTGNGQIGIAQNGTQICIVDGTYGYIYTLATDTFVQITDPDFPACDTVVFQDTYFIVPKKNSAAFYISANGDGTSWNALDFAVAESNPDNLVTVISDKGNLWLFGQLSTEIYQNTGAAAFPFERISGGVIQTGCAAPFTAAKFDNTVIWLGNDEFGQAIIWIAEGYQARKVSTQAIDKRINSVTDFTDSYSWVYQEQGHIFYCLQINGLDTTLVYDGSTGLWHERQYQGNSPHRGSCHFFFGQKNLIGDRLNGNIYELSTKYYDDAGVEIQRTRIMPHIQDEKRQIIHSNLELDMEVGVGLTSGQGSDPQIMMQYSSDGGRTWSNELWTTIGKIGEYSTRVKWLRLGMARDRVYRVMISDPIFVQINGAYLNAT